jgi:hypothetical protein
MVVLAIFIQDLQVDISISCPWLTTGQFRGELAITVPGAMAAAAAKD